MASSDAYSLVSGGLVLALLLGPAAVAAAEPGLVRGSIFPDGVVYAEGRVFIPPSQGFVSSWSTNRGYQDGLLKGVQLSAFVDEWRWTGPTQAPQDPGSTMPMGIHTSTHLVQANSTLRILRAGENNRWYYSGLRGGTSFLAGQATDCDFYAAQPTALAMRVASSPLAIAKGVQRAQVPGTGVLHLDCGVAQLGFDLTGSGTYELAAFDVDLQFHGNDPTTMAPSVFRVAAGSFSEHNESFPHLYDNLVRHVSIQAAPGSAFETHARRVAVESPLLQVEGDVLLPPFDGDLHIGTTKAVGVGKTTRLSGNLLVVPGSHRGADVGIELAGSSAVQSAAAPASRGLDAATMGIAVLVTAAAAFVALLVAKSKQVLIAAVGLFTRLTPVRALEHDLRKAIYDYVVENPGVRLHAAYKALGLNRSTFTHHAQALHHQGLIVLQRDGRKMNLFPSSMPSSDARQALALTRDPFVQRLLSAIEGSQELTQAEIAKRLDVSQAYVSKKLARLEDRGVIVRRKGATGTHYEVRVQAR